MSDRTYFVEIVLTLNPDHTEHLVSDQQTREIAVWADSLGATVEIICVRSEDRSERS